MSLRLQEAMSPRENLAEFFCFKFHQKCFVSSLITKIWAPGNRSRSVFSVTPYKVKTALWLKLLLNDMASKQSKHEGFLVFSVKIEGLSPDKD